MAVIKQAPNGEMYVFLKNKTEKGLSSFAFLGKDTFTCSFKIPKELKGKRFKLKVEVV